jgi:hypothetical protein
MRTVSAMHTNSYANAHTSNSAARKWSARLTFGELASFYACTGGVTFAFATLIRWFFSGERDVRILRQQALDTFDALEKYATLFASSQVCAGQ